MNRPPNIQWPVRYLGCGDEEHVLLPKDVTVVRLALERLRADVLGGLELRDRSGALVGTPSVTVGIIGSLLHFFIKGEAPREPQHVASARAELKRHVQVLKDPEHKARARGRFSVAANSDAEWEAEAERRLAERAAREK